jgi:hypothetical protein
MSDRFLVEFDRRAVGVAVRVAGGFRFFASDLDFGALEGRIFPRVRSLMGQVTRTGRKAQSRRSPVRRGLRPRPC